MNKDFDGWNKVKQRTNAEHPRLYTVREIWWCRLGANVGSEQDGKGDFYVRPCVVLHAFGSDACLVVPLTTSQRDHRYRIAVGSIEDKIVRANISQIRTVDTRRLERKIGFLDTEQFTQLKKHVRELFL